MNARQELNEAYEEWRRLAEAEGEAIGSCNWSQVAACQAALGNLQQRITRLTPAARAERSAAGPDRQAWERRLNETLQELLHLARRNHTLLVAIKQATRAKLDQLGQAGRNLNQLRHSYGGRSLTTWNSFS